ncbi:MAG: MOSC domain-containing protein [Gammaproteobacteria bacterium]|nr:MOSC domain-containing protein [Gammaproteobacteria bacterium]
MLGFIKSITQFLGINAQSAKLSAIFITESGGQPMHLVKTVNVIKDGGLEGDRYNSNTGYWHRVEACQVTLISEHDLMLAEKSSSLTFRNGEHRRNLVISGLKTKQLEGKLFRIGEVVFRYDKKRPPCGYLNKIEGRGRALALSYNSGVCIKVLQGGRISVGDKVYVVKEKNKEKDNANERK